MKKLLPLAIVLATGLTAGATPLSAKADSDVVSICPELPPSSVRPKFEAKVEHDSKTGLYTYSYTVGNEKDGLLPIEIFEIQIDEPPVKILAPERWDHPSFKRSYVVWATFESDRISIPGHVIIPSPFMIFPGKRLSGFVIQSRKPPGVVRFSARGWLTQVPRAFPTEDDDEPHPNCPGFNYDEHQVPFEDNGEIVGVTVGPAREGVVSLRLKLKPPKKPGDRDDDADDDEREIALNPEKDKGLLRAELSGDERYGTQKLDIRSIDVASLRLGVGKAPAASSKVDGRKLKLEFDLQKVGIHCDVDLALFVTGKTLDGKSILAGAPIMKHLCKHTREAKPVDITPKTLSTEEEERQAEEERREVGRKHDEHMKELEKRIELKEKIEKRGKPEEKPGA